MIPDSAELPQSLVFTVKTSFANYEHAPVIFSGDFCMNALLFQTGNHPDGIIKYSKTAEHQFKVIF